MTIEEIKNAINRCNLEIECMKEAFARYAKIETMTQKAIEEMKEDEIFLNQSETIKKALENELERLENKPLDLEALKNMIGEPIWHYGECDVISEIYADEKFYDDWYVDTHRGTISVIERNQFYKYKPQEVQGD